MYAWRIIYGIRVEIGVRDVLIFDEYKKKKRAPRLGNSRTVTNPFLIYNINLLVNKSQL